MAPTANSIAANGARPTLAATGHKWPRFSGVMRVVRSCLTGGKYESIADDLAAALGCSQRTARRIIAGQSVSSDTTLAVLTHDTLGPPLLSEILARVPLERREAMAEALREAAELARLEAEQIRVAKDIAERKARR